MFASLRINLVLLITLFFSLTLTRAYSVPSTVYGVSADDGTTMSAPQNHLMARAGTTLCATLTINLVDQNTKAVLGNIRPIHCYCNSDGVLTSATTSDINTAFAVNSGQINETNFQSYLRTNQLTRAQGISAVTSSITSGLNQKTTTCVYPAGSIPTSCTTCTFTCPTNQKACGTTCIASTATCQSGSTVKREFQRKRCANGFEMCATGMLGFGGKAAGWECVNTEADLESCGGCQQPMEGGKQGQDCTAIPGADEIACISGGCKVNSCLRGYKLVDNACIPSTAAEDQKTYSRRSRATGIPARHRR